MESKYNSTDSYYAFVLDKILKLAPVIGLSAALTFTVARLIGWFAYVEMTSLIAFDVACISYFVIVFFVRKFSGMGNGTVEPRRLTRINIILVAVVLLQWNLITYIFPTRAFWGYAPMFVLLTAFLFNSKAVLAEIVGISASIATSWLILGEKLLPVNDGLFGENFVLRIIALVISFAVIYILTCFAERFTVMVKENTESLAEKNRELEMMGRDIIDFTADIIEERDSTSGSHVKRLKTYTRILATQLKADYPEYHLDDGKIEQITLACVLHDVGKIGIPDSILLKPGRLTPEEFDVIKTHTVLGAKVINKLPDSVGEEYKRYCREICLFHHERYDGKGYPTGLRGEEIPVSAQIVAVVDCYDALTNMRPYKPALPGEVALNMILAGECGAFSDKIKASILACKEQLLKG